MARTAQGWHIVWRRGIARVHFTHAGRRYDIRAAADKNRLERTIPVSTRARGALERGLPFGAKDRRAGFAGAVRRALGPDRHLTPYDLKHARITAWLNAGEPVGGVAWLTGVSIETLTSRYAHASRQAADQIIRGHSVAAVAVALCEGRDLNPDGVSTASTSSECGINKSSLFSCSPLEHLAPERYHIPVSVAGPQKDEDA